MGSVVLIADETVAARPDVVYGLFGAREGAGWVKDFEPVIDAITRSGADLVLSTLVGSDEVAFERQCLAMGLRARYRTLGNVELAGPHNVRQQLRLAEASAGGFRLLEPAR